MQREPWRERTIPRLVEAAAERFGTARAIEDGGTLLGFDDLQRAGLEATRAFLAAGIEPGDRVAIWAPNQWEWVVAAIGLQSAGAVLCPLNTRWKGGEAARTLRKCGARIVCTVSEFLGADYVAMLREQELPALEQIVVLRGESEGAIPWREFLARGRDVPESRAVERGRAVGEDDPSDMIFTSGTTGQPKGVLTAHGQNLRVFETWSEGVGLRADDRYLIAGPFFHTFGYKAGWLACLLRGATMFPLAVFDPGSTLEKIEKDRITVFPGAPTFYQSLLAHADLHRHDLSSLRLAVTGAATIPVELIRRMREELGFDTVLTAYGLTESCGTVSMCLQDDDPETIATTSGRAIPGVEVRCVDAKGAEVPRGEPGEVVVRGYNVMLGYYDEPEQTREAIDAEGWLHTGDVGVMDERGYLRITDRLKDMFITGGFNCYPAEIENLMFEHPEVAQVAVIGVPDERMGEVGMAFVVPRPGAAPTAEGLHAWCREHMANYKVPRRFEILDALPTNATGKVSKVELRERAAAGGGAAAP